LVEEKLKGSETKTRGARIEGLGEQIGLHLRTRKKSVEEGSVVRKMFFRSD